jgi:hypothetical protein
MIQWLDIMFEPRFRDKYLLRVMSQNFFLTMQSQQIKQRGYTLKLDNDLTKLVCLLTFKVTYDIKYRSRRCPSDGALNPSRSDVGKGA